MEATNTWAPSPEHPGYRYKTIQRGAYTVCVLRPELDEGEQTKREGHARAVAERVLKDYYIRKEKQNNEREHHHN